MDLNKTTNTLILDYLLHITTKSVLLDKEGGRRLIGLVDGLLHSFRKSGTGFVGLSRRCELTQLAILMSPPSTPHGSKFWKEALPLFIKVSADSFRALQAEPGRIWLTLCGTFIVLASRDTAIEFDYPFLKTLKSWQKFSIAVRDRITSNEEVNEDTFREEVRDFLVSVLEEMDEPELCRYGGSESELPPSLLRSPGMISIMHDKL